MTNPKAEPVDQKKTGIPDWDLKFDAIERLATSKGGGGTLQQIAGWILNVPAKDPAAEQLALNFRKWKQSQPTGSVGRNFVNALMGRFEEFGCKSSTTAATFMHKPYRDFWGMFPEDVRVALQIPAQAILNESEQTVVQTKLRDQDAFHPLWIARAIDLGVKPSRGRVDQKFYFLNPDSAHTWKGVINAGQYKQFTECSHALEALLNDQVWLEFISSGSVDGAVMLGGGGPTKDLAIIGSMLDQMKADTIHYTVVDISIYMLMHAVQMIDSVLIMQKRRARVDLCPLIWDFTDLPGASPKLRRPGKSVAWFLPGGTIGNLNESGFFYSLSKEAEVGDLFVVGAETLGTVDLEAEKAVLVKKYQHPAIRSFLGTPLRAVWHELNLHMSMEDGLDNLKIDVVDGLRSRHSTIPGSASIEISVDAHDGQKIVLLTSTRYTEADFVEAVETHRFKHEITVPSSSNKNYKQFVFRCGS